MPFRFLAHTADVQVECRAATFEDLLRTAAEALYALTLNTPPVRADASRRVEITSASREDLLVRWLQELNFLLDTDHFAAVEVTFESAGPDGVRAQLRGAMCSADQRAEEVKSATYQELGIQETADGFIARVILDL